MGEGRGRGGEGVMRNGGERLAWIGSSASSVVTCVMSARFFTCAKSARLAVLLERRALDRRVSTRFESMCFGALWIGAFWSPIS